MRVTRLFPRLHATGDNTFSRSSQKSRAPFTSQCEPSFFFFGQSGGESHLTIPRMWTAVTNSGDEGRANFPCACSRRYDIFPPFSQDACYDFFFFCLPNMPHWHWRDRLKTIHLLGMLKWQYCKCDRSCLDKAEWILIASDLTLFKRVFKFVFSIFAQSLLEILWKCFLNCPF